MTRRATAWLLAITLALVIGWDIYVAVNSIRGDTVSELTLGWSQKFWILPVAIGIVSGHLFWPLTKPRPPWISAIVLIVSTVVTIVLDIVGHAEIIPVIPFAIGVLIGHFGWGQRT